MPRNSADAFADRYLRRLGVADARAGGGPDPGLLRELHAAHLERVPFENLSIQGLRHRAGARPSVRAVSRIASAD
ncbi:MAG TPA: hypothetical protein VGG75_24795 [Trebonia sp.]